MSLQLAIDFISHWAEIGESPLAIEKTHFLMTGPKNRAQLRDTELTARFQLRLMIEISDI